MSLINCESEKENFDSSLVLNCVDRRHVLSFQYCPVALSRSERSLLPGEAKKSRCFRFYMDGNLDYMYYIGVLSKETSLRGLEAKLINGCCHVVLLFKHPRLNSSAYWTACGPITGHIEISSLAKERVRLKTWKRLNYDFTSVASFGSMNLDISVSDVEFMRNNLL